MPFSCIIEGYGEGTYPWLSPEHLKRNRSDQIIPQHITVWDYNPEWLLKYAEERDRITKMQGEKMSMKHSDEVIQKSWVVCGLALVCCLLWGSAFPCIKIGYEMFGIASSDTASQILFAGARFTLAGVLTVVIGSILSRRLLVPGKGSWGMVLKLCLFQTVIQYLLFYVGLAHTTGVKSSIIEAANVFLAILVSSLLFRYEKLGKGKILGCIVGFAGVVLINFNGSGLDTSMSFLGEGCILLSTVSYAFSSVLIKRYSQKENPVTLSGYQFMAGGIVMVFAGLLLGGRLHPGTAASVCLLLYMALISAVAYSLWGILLKYNSVGRVTVYGFMNPVFGVILSAVLLGEKNQAFTLRGLISLILVCAGIFMVNKEQTIEKNEQEQNL